MKGHRNVPECCDEEGNLDQYSHYQETFVHFFTEIQQKHPDIISDNVNVGEEYDIRGSFRMIAEVRALN